MPKIADRKSIVIVVSDSLRTDGRAYMPRMRQFQEEYPTRVLQASHMFADNPTSDGGAFSLLYALGDAARHLMQAHNRSSATRDTGHDWGFVQPVPLQVLRGNGYRLRLYQAEKFDEFPGGDWMFYNKERAGGPDGKLGGIVWDSAVLNADTELLATRAMDDLDADLAAGVPTLVLLWTMDTHFDYNVPARHRHAYHGGPKASLEQYRAAIRATDELFFHDLRPRWERHVNAGRALLHFGSDHGDQFLGEGGMVARGHDTMAGPRNTALSCIGTMFFPNDPYRHVAAAASRMQPPPPTPRGPWGHTVAVGSNVDVLPTLLDYLGVSDDILPVATYSAGTSWLRPTARKPYQIIESLGPLEYRTRPPAIILIARGRKYRVLLRTCPRDVAAADAPVISAEANTQEESMPLPDILQPRYCGELTHSMLLDDTPLATTAAHRREANHLLHVHHCRTRGCCLHRGDVDATPCGSAPARTHPPSYADPVPELRSRFVLVQMALPVAVAIVVAMYLAAAAWATLAAQFAIRQCRGHGLARQAAAWAA